MEKFKDTHIQSLFYNRWVYKIFGTAGSGKTTVLIKELEKLFEDGIRPSEVAFVSFTNKAVNELVERSLKKFDYFNEKEFFNFRTIHSMCYSTLKSQGKKVITRDQLSELAKKSGFKVSRDHCIEDGFGNLLGDKVIQLESLARLRMTDLKEQWRESRIDDCPFFAVEEWRERFSDYKKKNGLIDFTDMLGLYKSQLESKYCFVDECQDLSPLQWDVVNRATVGCEKVFLAGDDDQSIYNWAGAETDYFLNVRCDKETVLSQSYRLPANIYNLSRDILTKIKVRKKKETKQNTKNGTIKKYFDFNSVDFKRDEEYLILVRNRFQIKQVKDMLEKKGLIYFLFDKKSIGIEEKDAIILWERSRKLGSIQHHSEFLKIKKFSNQLKNYAKKEEVNKSLFEKEWYHVLNLIPQNKAIYIRNVLKNKYRLGDTPKIKLSTIHQAKGGECDNVVLFTDVSNATYEQLNTDNEHKVWYVAITRSKKNLIIIREQSNKFYRI
jgi:superfamily I DNA/RNA helicase